jgi:hypothetical protein
MAVVAAIGDGAEFKNGRHWRLATTHPDGRIEARQPALPP